jgi:DNA replication protein DnaC
MQKRSALFKQLAKADLLVLDDFGLAPLSDETVRDLIEILDDCYDHCATLITSQLPIDQWHAYLDERTVADAILDHLVHDSCRVVLKGESMRRHKTVETKRATPSKSKGH